jgi:hypothetical protein
MRGNRQGARVRTSINLGGGLLRKLISSIFASALLVISFSASASAQDSPAFDEKALGEALKKMPGEAKRPEDFVPAGWEIYSQTEGDLNGDGLNDYALDITPKGARNESFYAAVVVLFAEGGGKLRRFAVNDRLSPCAGSGFECGQNLTIKKDVLVANSNFGNNQATDVTYLFRFDKAVGKLMLIGLAYETYTRAGNEDGYVKSYNFLTGVKEEKTKHIDRRKNTTRVYDRSSVKRSRFKTKKVSFEAAQLNYLESGEVLPY